MRDWYRGPQTRGGSTGVRVEDCTFNGVTVGCITSPNGYTQNAEMTLLQNIRAYAVKYVIVGCQSQEKMNKVTNLGAWGPTNCVFVFNRYGAQQPGNWFIDGVNIAGAVDSIIYRTSTGWGNMTLKNVFAEQIKSIGWWYAGSGDVFAESLINLKTPDELGYFPENSLNGRYLRIQDVNVRYYGMEKTPVLLQRSGEVIGGGYYLPPITGNYGNEKGANYVIDQPFYESKEKVRGNKATVSVKAGSEVSAGDHVIFMQPADWSFLGQGQIESVSGGKAIIRYISPSVMDLSKFRIGVYHVVKK